MQPCLHWLQVFPSFTESTILRWIRPSREQCSKCPQCPAYIWHLSTSYWVWRRLLLRLHVSVHKTVFSPFSLNHIRCLFLISLLRLCYLFLSDSQQPQRHRPTVPNPVLWWRMFSGCSSDSVLLLCVWW